MLCAMKRCADIKKGELRTCECHGVFLAGSDLDYWASGEVENLLRSRAADKLSIAQLT